MGDAPTSLASTVGHSIRHPTRADGLFRLIGSTLLVQLTGFALCNTFPSHLGNEDSTVPSTEKSRLCKAKVQPLRSIVQPRFIVGSDTGARNANGFESAQYAR